MCFDPRHVTNIFFFDSRGFGQAKGTAYFKVWAGMWPERGSGKAGIDLYYKLLLNTMEAIRFLNKYTDIHHILPIASIAVMDHKRGVYQANAWASAFLAEVMFVIF